MSPLRLAAIKIRRPKACQSPPISCACRLVETCAASDEPPGNLQCDRGTKRQHRNTSKTKRKEIVVPPKRTASNEKIRRQEQQTMPQHVLPSMQVVAPHASPPPPVLPKLLHPAGKVLFIRYKSSSGTSSGAFPSFPSHLSAFLIFGRFFGNGSTGTCPAIKPVRKELMDSFSKFPR